MSALHPMPTATADVLHFGFVRGADGQFSGPEYFAPFIARFTYALEACPAKEAALMPLGATLTSPSRELAAGRLSAWGQVVQPSASVHHWSRG